MKKGNRMQTKKIVLFFWIISLFLFPQKLFSLTDICCEACRPLCGKTFLPIRSQNTNAARHFVGHHLLKLRHNMETINGVFTLTPQYGQSFKPCHIAQYFFATDTLRFSGSQIENRGECDILADYFGLSQTFEGTARLKPQIKTFLLDIDFFLGLDRLKKGLYFEAYAPVVRTKWSMCICEEIINSGVDTPFVENYMAPQEITPPVSSIATALHGGVAWGDVREGIKFGRFTNCAKETKVADVTLVLGYLIVNKERGYAGLNLRGTIPTGTRPQGVYIFEPVVGNGRHAEVGVGFVGQINIWEKDGDQQLAMHVDTNFTHLFKAKQCRSFDLCRDGCPNYISRYMLLKCFDTNGGYSGVTVPAINVTTLCCDVKVDFQADLNLMFAYTNRSWEFDFGYNAWIRTHEKICLLDSIALSRYRLKGIQDVNNLGVNNTQSGATIYGNNFDFQEEVADANSPVFISNADIDICSASAPLALTHKFYWHVSHAWRKTDEKRFIPLLGIGGQLEFESVKPRDVHPYKNTLNQWALWLKGGFAFS